MRVYTLTCDIAVLGDNFVYWFVNFTCLNKIVALTMVSGDEQIRMNKH